MSEALQHEIELNKEVTKAGDRVPLPQKMAYGMGVVSDHYANVCLSIFFMAFFKDFMGVSAALIGAAMMTARIWDAFTDPMVGVLSDKSKSRFGRRKPFIFVGSILTGLFFPMIWMARESWGQTGIVVYLFCALLMFYTFYSIFSVPYESLGAELTPDYKERTNIFVIRTYVQQTFNLGIMWIFPFATWLAAKPYIDGEIGGVRAVSWLIGAMIIGAGILPAIFCVERYGGIAAKQEKTGSFIVEAKTLLQNKPLMIVIGIICTYLLAIIATMNLAYFVNTYYVYGGSIHAGAKLGAIDGTLRFGFALLGAWVIKRLQNKYDKHHMMMACVVILLVAFVGIIFTTIPGRPWLTLTMKPLLAFGEVGFWILIMSMRADVCDWDELKSNRRREGLIAASTNWFTKMTIAAAMLMSGLLLENFVRFDSKLSDEAKAKIEQQAAVDFATVTEEAKIGIEAEHGTFVRVFKAFGDDGSGLPLKGRIKEAYLDGGIPPVTLDTVTEELKNKEIMAKQSPGTMRRLLYSYTIPQIIALIIAFFLLMKYPLTHERLSSIRKDLEERRGTTISS